MKLEELTKGEDRRLGRIRREFKDVKSLFKEAIGYKPSKEEQEKNLNTWEGKLFTNHYYISAVILIGLLGVTVSGFAYAGITLLEHLKNLYTN